jgi:hypothetical protein
MSKKSKSTGLKDLVGDAGGLASPPPGALSPSAVESITHEVHGQRGRVGRPPSSEQTAKFTTNLERGLLKQVKRHCVEADMTVREYIEESLRKNLGGA